ncbi:glycosyl hydrolase family 16 [Pyrenophora seminiperda CCB06]|uniref:chitinase n=1 Tax=Pyrenophora seminiperda CCB06 TaxID=1302712 RepID=A0A3M7LW28_9PLEO|nr:glycosyl hydrolase family 16 [Pyrenophora seminiperda CCB06]
MRFSTYTTASALVALAAAQTFTDCNPMEKTCPNDPAMPQTWETDFTAGKASVKGWKVTSGNITYGPDGAQFTITKPGEGPTIGSEGFFHFGYVEVVMKAAPGQGIISSIVLQSDNLDEVDWEWIGGVDSRVQQNYFGKGNTTTFDRMIEAPVANNQNAFHKYALNWTAESLTWIVDDKPTRTLKFADANGGKNYPQTPCNVRLGNWAGGDSKDAGTIQWAGGKVNYAAAPFTMTVKSVKVINYSPGKEYTYSDKTGAFGSIKVVEAGNAAGAAQNNVPIDAAASGTGSQAPLASGINVPPLTGAAANSTGEAPCDCGTATVTVTGAPPASFSTKFPASTGKLPATTAKPPSVPVGSAAPYPTSGIAMDTRPAPGVNVPVPTGALPQQSGKPSISVSAPPSQFTGAATHVKAGGLVGAVMGAVLLAF